MCSHMSNRYDSKFSYLITIFLRDSYLLQLTMSASILSLKTLNRSSFLFWKGKSPIISRLEWFSFVQFVFTRKSDLRSLFSKEIVVRDLEELLFVLSFAIDSNFLFLRWKLKGKGNLRHFFCKCFSSLTC